MIVPPKMAVLRGGTTMALWLYPPIKIELIQIGTIEGTIDVPPIVKDRAGCAEGTTMVSWNVLPDR